MTVHSLKLMLKSSPKDYGVKTDNSVLATRCMDGLTYPHVVTATSVGPTNSINVRKDSTCVKYSPIIFNH